MMGSIKLDLSKIANDKISGVYKMTFDNGMFYIGSAKHIKQRARAHLKGLKTGFNYQKNIMEAAKGSQTVEVVVLEICSIDELAKREMAHIQICQEDPLLINKRKPQASKKTKTGFGNKAIVIGEFNDELTMIATWTAKQLAELFSVSVTHIRRNLAKGHKIRERLFYKMNENNQPIIPSKERKPRKKRAECISPNAKRVGLVSESGDVITEFITIAQAAKSIQVPKRSMRDHLHKRGYADGIKGHKFRFL